MNPHLVNTEPTSLEARSNLWHSLTTAHPEYLDGVTLSAAGLKALFEVVAMQSFAAGRKWGIAEALIESELVKMRRRNFREFLKHINRHFGEADIAPQEKPAEADRRAA